MRFTRVFIVVFLFTAAIARGQSRSNLGIGIGLNKPFPSDYNTGFSAFFRADIALGVQLGIVPDIGYDRLASKNSDPLIPEGIRTDNINQYYFRLALKYHFYRNWFISAGPMVYMANGYEDTDGIDLGGSASVGYNLDLDTNSTLIFSFNTDVVDIHYNGHGNTAIAGLKVAYVINFKRRNK